MANIRFLLASGEEFTEADDSIDEIDEVRDRFKQPGKPDWVVFGDCVVFSQTVEAAQLV